MITARPSLATINFHCLQYCIKRPIIIILLCAISCCLVFIHQIYSDDVFSSQDHPSRLTRRNSTALDYNFDGKLARNKKTNEDVHYSEVDALLTRIEDLRQIKLSISNELRQIEQEKGKLLKEKASLVSKNEKLSMQITKSKLQLKQLELDIFANRKRKFEQTCDSNRVAPVIFNPMKSVDLEQSTDIRRNHDLKRVRIAHRYQYDLSQCPLTSNFKFHLISNNVRYEKVTVLTDERQKYRIESTVVQDLLTNHRQYTNNLEEACLFIHLVDENLGTSNLNQSKNNLVINLSRGDLTDYLKDNPFDKAAIASALFANNSFRNNFDIILPSIWQSPSNYDLIVGSIPSQSLPQRKYLASYFGQDHPQSKSGTTIELNSLEKTLQIIHRNSIDDLFLFIYNCGQNLNVQCYEEKEKMLELSTFLVIFHQLGTDSTSDLIYLALSRGTIPVIFHEARTRLPFDEVVDWHRASLLLPTARLPELHFILSSIAPADIYQLKYYGRRIFENYLTTAKQILDTLISSVSIQRFNYPPPPVQDIKTVLHNNENNKMVNNLDCTSTACIEAKTEILGPRELPLKSRSYMRNYSLIFTSSYDLWNSPLLSPLLLYPSSPNDPIPPSDYKFLAQESSYRPINDGLGGSGNEFSRSLGGDFPNEQFTIVLLTYERRHIMMKTLERLKGLPYLNKVLVVWNGIHHEPAPDMAWPDIGAPILVVKVDQNSLNNRFLPYDAIETDAVLSLDDDSPLRPDEIVFAFRVWRQSRDRIVGFPGRFHAWDSQQNSWMYNSNYSCELSMVLTGGAFFHKYYTYIYTYQMPQAIRLIVDKFMNCEDIAMNFLVAHLTRKPPIKVTSRWTFHCAECPSSLSKDESHFRERHECLNTFASIYGYMPLLSTQHRSDSVLFKTRLPAKEQKCFKFI